MRVVITGAGLVTSLGRDVASTWRGLLEGRRAIAPMTLFDPAGHRSTIAAEVHDLPMFEVDGPDGARAACSRTDAMAIVAATEALASAHLDAHALRGLRVGVVVGGTTGGMFETEAKLARMISHAPDRRPLAQLLSHPLSATAARLGERFGPIAKSRTVCSACSSGANAFAIGRAWLMRDEVDVVLAGGTDALARLTFAGFNALGAIDPEPTRPFDVRRRGLSIGEGAGFAVLERSDHARYAPRGATPWAALIGVGIASEAHHITNPEATGAYAARAIEAAMRDAGVDARDVDYVNAHGTGTPLNDAMEAAAIGLALGEETSRVLVSSTKAAIGHTLAAAGAIEAIITALAIRDARVPPTVGLEEIDPKCATLRHVQGAAIDVPIRVALSSSFGFGGVDTVLALAHTEHAQRAERPLRATTGVAPARTTAAARTIVVVGVGSASRAGVLAGIENTRLIDGAADRGAPLDPTSSLDPARARRLDRSARLATVAARLAGAQSGDGLVVGTAYGDTDASAAFVEKLISKGPRLVPPADFPNLVPSSPSGHASIFLGLHGPVMSVADLSTSGEAAVATALDLLLSGAADALVAGSLEGPNELVRECIAPAFRAIHEGQPDLAHVHALERTEGSAMVRLVAVDADTPERAPRVGDVVLVAAQEAPSLRALPTDAACNKTRAIVVASEITDTVRGALADSGWGGVPVYDVIGAVGRHEGLGGFAIAAAVALLMRGDADEARVLGEGELRAWSLTLRRVVAAT